MMYFVMMSRAPDDTSLKIFIFSGQKIISKYTLHPKFTAPLEVQNKALFPKMEHFPPQSTHLKHVTH